MTQSEFHRDTPFLRPSLEMEQCISLICKERLFISGSYPIHRTMDICLKMVIYFTMAGLHLKAVTSDFRTGLFTKLASYWKRIGKEIFCGNTRIQTIITMHAGCAMVTIFY